MSTHDSLLSFYKHNDSEQGRTMSATKQIIEKKCKNYLVTALHFTKRKLYFCVSAFKFITYKFYIYKENFNCFRLTAEQLFYLFQIKHLKQHFCHFCACLNSLSAFMYLFTNLDPGTTGVIWLVDTVLLLQYFYVV